MASTEQLYTPELLALAVELADWPLADNLPLYGEARSPTCGSVVRCGLDVDGNGQISQLGLQVQACAIGQASAAIFARHARGASSADLALALDQIKDWQSGGSLPAWPDFDKLTAAQPHKGRHGAILLPWKAAQQALCSAALPS